VSQFPRGGRGTYPYNDGSNLVAELFVNADESGMHAKPTWVLVYGYIAGPETWDAFGQDWNGILADPEYAIEVFHAIDFFQGRKPFREWKAEKRNQFLGHLVEAINRHKLYPVGRGISYEAFMAQPTWFRRYLTGGRLRSEGIFVYTGAPNDAYHVALQELMTDALARADEHAMVHFIMGQQDRVEGYAVGHLNRIRTIMEAEGDSRARQLGSIAYSTGTITKGLQAAALWNYLCQSKLMRGSLTGRAEWALKALAEQVDHDVKLWDRGTFATAYDEVLRRLPAGALERLEKENS